MRACLLLCLFCLGSQALAHDPSAWGGVYRSRDDGASWLPADAGLFIGGALALSVSPTDPDHLLYATDARLLRSVNGGRDWKQDGGGVVAGPALMALFDHAGSGAIASTAAGVFWTADGKQWRDAGAPAGAAPARAAALGVTPGRVYLAGTRGLFRSDDTGRSWSRIGHELPEGAVTALLVLAVPTEHVFALVAGELWNSRDGGASWHAAAAGLPHGRVEAVASDPQTGGRLWAGANDHVFASADGGATWTAVGEPLPERETSIRGIATAGGGQVVVLSTHRGIYRSQDGARTWVMVESALPTHLEAGPLVRDPHDPSTLYAGFALTPYTEIWRRADEGNNLLSQVDPVSLAGGAAFMLLLVLLGVLGARWLSRNYSARDGAAPASERRPGETAR